MSSYFTYILTNKENRLFYVGVTNNLYRRVYEHKNKMADGFTKKYGIDKLVYKEGTNEIDIAIKREKELKRWKRSWKVKLIEKENPQWKDLFNDIYTDE